VILLNKPKYLTSLETIKKFQKQNPKYSNIKLGYVGTLDPMATGLLLVLEGIENKNRNEYIGLNKTYEFEILFGISTDSYDLLGLITHINNNYESTITNLDVSKFVGSYNQKFPPFSAKIKHGKRLYNLARKTLINENDLPEYKRKIISMKLIGSKTISKSKLLNDVKKTTQKVAGDFRQNKIYKNWKEQNAKMRENYNLLKIETEVSSGTYVRRLCVDIAKKYNQVAIAYSINRLKIGNYHVKDSIQISE